MTQPQRVVPPVKPVAGYRRPMKGWYLHARPPYRIYLLREATCLAVAYFALLVIVGLFRLKAGPEAWEAFLACLRSPLMVVVNLAAAGLIGFHAITWFMVMPKTMPFIFIGGKRLQPHLIVAGGIAGMIGASLALLIAFWMTAP
ncbi:MAG: fumarate reductase subunit C [Lautropia sp.]|nr:fumarate reductase subunit C [Lautropia sp.]